MTEPIRDKFDRLDDSMGVRHGQILDALGDLQTLIEPPIDYSAGFASLGQKIDLANEGLGLVNAALVAIAEVLPGLATTATAINNQLADANSRLTTMDDNLQQVQNTLGLHNGGAEFTLASLVRAISAGIALVNENTLGIKSPWPANVLAALECVCESTSALLPIDPTDPTNPNTCAEPYVSSEMLVLPFSWIGVTRNLLFARFPAPPPSGLTFGSIFGIGEDETELIASDWSGWRVFVQSEAPQYSDNPSGFERYSTNQWRELSGSGSKAFSTDDTGSITVYLCYTAPAGPIPSGECVDYPINVPDNEGYMQIEIPTGMPSNYTYTVLKDGFYGRAGPQGAFNGPHTGNVPYTYTQLQEYGTWIYTNSRDVYQLRICNPAV